MEKDRTVYSSATGRLCPHCQRKKTKCICRIQMTSTPVGDGNVRIRREKKGRGGKTVTTISGLPLDETNLKKLGSNLKRQCGTGGAVKNGVIEIQGDHVDFLLEQLRAEGYHPKKSGG